MIPVVVVVVVVAVVVFVGLRTGIETWRDCGFPPRRIERSLVEGE